MLEPAVEKPMPVCRSATCWRSQFAHPQGWRGWVVGHRMALKNRERSLWVLSLLGVRPDDRVLEIGFGPGVDIRRIAQRVRAGFVAGIDHSEMMLRQATERNRDAIRVGRVALQQGDAAHLPFAAQSFDVVFAINVAQFWNPLSEAVAEIHRVLKPRGCVALAVQPRNRGATEEDSERTAEVLTTALSSARLASVRLERRPMKPVSTICAIGQK